MNKDDVVVYYAYVRFIDDDKFETVTTNKIMKFDEENVNFSLKYKVEWKDGVYYWANIIYLNDTLEELNAQILKKRVKLTPKTFLVSQSEEDNEVVEEKKGKKKTSKCRSRDHNQFKPIEESIMKAHLADLSIKTKDKGCQTNLLEPRLELEEIQLLQKELADVKKLNKKLQEIVIEKFSDCTNIAMPTMTEPTKTPIGEIVPGTEEIHIGHNMTISKTAFNDCCNQKTSSLFVRMLVVHVFGIETLKVSSVSGKSSNRTKGPSKPKLDPTKMAAILEAHKYYLEKKGTDDFQLLTALAKTSQYVTAKINDMNRLLRGKKPPHINEHSNEHKDSGDEDGDV